MRGESRVVVQDEKVGKMFDTINWVAAEICLESRPLLSTVGTGG
jgi:hypothetical protein